MSKPNLVFQRSPVVGSSTAEFLLAAHKEEVRRISLKYVRLSFNKSTVLIQELAPTRHTCS